MAEGSEKRAEDMTVSELRERASELEITGRSSMNKEELLQSVKDAEEQTAFLASAPSGSDASAESDDSEDSAEDWRPPEPGAANGEGSGASDPHGYDSGSDDSTGNGSHSEDSTGSESDSDDSTGNGSDSGDSTGNGSDKSGSGDGEEDASDITAPSIGPNTTIEHVPPDERLDLDKISDVDAMGLDKRRQVGGQRYGASPAKQAAVYGGALALIVAVVIGAKLLADELDQPPAVQEDTAPWSQGEQKPPARIDFPRSTEQ